MIDIENQKERALAVTVIKKGSDRESAEEYLTELVDLAKTAGAEVVGTIYQELPYPNRATLIGKGKVVELQEMIEEEKIDMVVFDNDLSPVQARNLENKLKLKILDRSGIILDIFSSRAKTQEAKTQVELAQLQYILPRLSGMWTHLSKQYGGIGMKGPGETQIETDRRMIREKIQRLKAKLELIDTQRAQQRKNRDKLPRFALVGYTNAGKSTLLNTITSADTYVEDQLFATLDTTVRSFDLPDGQKALLSDTVGFIRKLPTHLVASFRSTLAEAAEAEFLLHVVDITHRYFEDHIEIVNRTLKSLNIDSSEAIIVFNKIDELEEMDILHSVETKYPNSIFISAKRSININRLLDLLQEKYDATSSIVQILLPYSESSLISKLFNLTEIISQINNDEGTIFELKIQTDNQKLFGSIFNKYRI